MGITPAIDYNFSDADSSYRNVFENVDYYCNDVTNFQSKGESTMNVTIHGSPSNIDLNSKLRHPLNSRTLNSGASHDTVDLKGNGNAR